MIGKTLAHFRITAKLGEGGMGTVYRAEDEKLGREVAIKVLPDAFAADAERLERFEREARVLASLNHPRIAGIHEVGEAEVDGSRIHFLVMELARGETLAVRLARGAIPIDEALALALQVAEALEAAHERGIVHRDLKPANIEVDTDGEVKILDFGLAKVPVMPTGTDLDLSDSPTLTAQMTRVGTMLGTAAYMSPEQARGREVDKRADIWAFGCVLFEMLAGRRAFSGGTSTEVLAQILEREPEWLALPPAVPPALHKLLGRCLQKEPKRRLRDAGDVALALEDLDLEAPLAAVDSRRSGRITILKFLPWLAAAAAAALAVVSWTAKSPSAPPQFRSALRFTESPPTALGIAGNNHSGPLVAVSPNGRVLAWIGTTDDSTQLFFRQVDQDVALPIVGTQGAQAPFFAADSEWIGFWADGKLKKVAVRGGVPQTICEIEHVHGASWGEEVIVMAAGEGTLYSVDAGGGGLQRIETSSRPGYLGAHPNLLPGSKAMLVSSQLGRANSSVELLSLDTGEITTLVNEGSNASYLPSGHLVWAQQANLLAAPFDLSSRKITGEARTVIEGVLTETHIGFLSHYAVSNEGTLAYLPGTFDAGGARPTWVKRDGTQELMPLPVDFYLSPRVSPDGQRLLLSRRRGSQSLWLAEPHRGVISPVTGEVGNQYWAIWTPDGAHMVFNSSRGSERANLWIQPVDRSEPPTRLTTAPAHQPPADITRDGRTVLFSSALAADDDMDVHLLHLDGEPITEPLLDTSANEIQPTLSHDDRWLAYASDVTGRLEVYVQPFPGLGGTIRVSPNGGQEPLWSPAGDRLYYRSLDGRRVLAVDIRGGESLQFGREEMLFEGDFSAGLRWGRKWDLHPDGDRFLMLELDYPEPPEGIRVVADWLGELERLVPTGR